MSCICAVMPCHHGGWGWGGGEGGWGGGEGGQYASAPLQVTRSSKARVKRNSEHNSANKVDKSAHVLSC